jgi:hypothetical protein
LRGVCVLPVGVIDENAPHRLRRGAVEVDTIALIPAP